MTVTTNLVRDDGALTPNVGRFDQLLRTCRATGRLSRGSRRGLPRSRAVRGGCASPSGPSAGWCWSGVAGRRRRVGGLRRAGAGAVRRRLGGGDPAPVRRPTGPTSCSTATAPPSPSASRWRTRARRPSPSKSVALGDEVRPCWQVEVDRPAVGPCIGPATPSM